MLMNFSPYIFILPEKYMSNDEKQMIEDAQKVEEKIDYEPLYEQL
jgi:hypothetical protein